MLQKLLFALALGVVATTALAVDPVTAANRAADTQAEQRVRDAVSKLANGQVDIASLKPSPLPGFYQVIAAGQLVYVSADGKYMLHGDLVDLAAHRNLTEAGWAAFRKAELAKVPASQFIVFAPPHPKYRVVVFTDVNCGYCRALHEHIEEINRLGIEVDYLAWPREGVHTTAGRDTPTYTEMVSVWCAADRQAAFTAAMSGDKPKPAQCAHPVRQQFELGLKLGVDSTPTIVDPDGYVVGGYLPPDKLLQMLQRNDARP